MRLLVLNRQLCLLQGELMLEDLELGYNVLGRGIRGEVPPKWPTPPSPPPPPPPLSLPKESGKEETQHTIFSHY